jgi:hypothetical protein
MTALVFFAGAALVVGAVRAWRRQPSMRAAGAYLGLTAAFFALPLFGGRLQVGSDIPYLWRPWSEAVAGPVQPANGLMWDIVLESLPYHTLARQRLLSGEAPLWAHELGTGQPFVGSASPFAPLHLLAMVLPPLRALTVAAAWQMLLGLLLMHALARALGASGAGAALAAVGFALSTFAVAWLYHPHAMTSAWLPGVLLGIVALGRQEARAFAGLTACGLGMALGGHPEVMAYGALVAVAFAGALLVRREPRDGLRSRDGLRLVPPEGPRPRDGLRLRPGFLLRLAGAGVLAACLAAPALLPLLESIPGSVRSSLVARRPEQVQPPPFTARLLEPVASPLAFGTPVDRAWSGPARGNFNELCSGYAGLVTLALALAGAVALGGRVAALLGGGLAALLAALQVGPFAGAVRLLPMVGIAPIGRLRLLWVLAVALGAGLSLDRLAAEARPRRAAAALLAAAAAAVAALPPDPGTPWQRVAWGAALLSAAAALAALLVPCWRPRFPAVALAGAAVELFLLGVRLQPAIDRRFELAPPPALAFLAARAHAAATPFRVLAEGPDLHPNLGALYGLWDPRGYDPLRPAAAARMVARHLRPRQDAADEIELARVHDRPVLDFLAVRFALLDHARRLPPPWCPAFDGAGGRVWENPAALPLFFLPKRVRRAASEEEALALALANHDFAAGAVRLGGGPGGGSGGGPGAEGGSGPGGGLEVEQTGEVRAIRPRSNGFDLEVRSPGGGLVASSVSWSPGWWVSVDLGAPAAVVEVVDGGFLGFAAPPGEHRVRLDYRPRGWVWGLRLAALGAAATLALLLRAAAAARTRRAPRAGTPPPATPPPPAALPAE